MDMVNKKSKSKRDIIVKSLNYDSNLLPPKHAIKKEGGYFWSDVHGNFYIYPVNYHTQDRNK